MAKNANVEYVDNTQLSSMWAKIKKFCRTHKTAIIVTIGAIAVLAIAVPIFLARAK